MNKLALFATKAVAKTKKHSPEILLGAGLVGIGVGVYFAVKGTLKVEEIISEAESQKADIEEFEAKEIGEYTHEDAQKDRMILACKTGLKFVKVYWPAVLCLVGGTGCILGSYGIMKKRHATLLAAYGTLESAFTKYREKVIATIGEEKEHYLRYGKPIKLEVISKDENGNEVKSKQTAMAYSDENNPVMTNPYAFCFDELCDDWIPGNPERNKNFLEILEAWANNKLEREGHLFLNDVRRAVHLSDTANGAICGWLKSRGDRVDFGIHDARFQTVRDFVNGRECAIWVLPNCSGVIYNEI